MHDGPYDHLPFAQGLVFTDPDTGKEYDYWSPSTKDEMKKWLHDFMGVLVPETAVCPGHTAPLDAIWEAYKAEASLTVWLASRGLGGKTTLLGALSALEFLDGMNIAILGGSSQQSMRVREVERAAWEHTAIVRDPNTGIPAHRVRHPFRRFLLKDPGMYETRGIKGNWLRALTASTRSARGPHPVRLRLDEIDEMDLLVFDASMGQTMEMRGKPQFRPQTVLSSTHQYPDGTFTEILKRASEKGWPVRKWCYRENLTTNGGWLNPSEIERKKSEVSNQMWMVEFELQEPSTEGRAFDTDAVKWMFSPTHKTIEDKVGTAYIIEKPRPEGKYATGADWAKDVDYTVIVTIRYDCEPAKIVAFEKVRRRPWPVMAQRLDKRLALYGGICAHDATGVGDVVDDYLAFDTAGVKMQGAARKELFTDYIIAVEDHRIVSPCIVSTAKDHEYCLASDLYGSGQGNHPPDSIVACSMAWRAILGKHLDKTPGKLLQPITF